MADAFVMHSRRVAVAAERSKSQRWVCVRADLMTGLDVCEAVSTSDTCCLKENRNREKTSGGM